MHRFNLSETIIANQGYVFTGQEVKDFVEEKILGLK